jgi:hypothetical protein
LDAREVRPFYTKGKRGGSSRTPTSTVVRGPDVDENNNISMTRHVKQFVKTKVVGTVQIGLRNLSSEVEGEVPMNFGYEEQLLGDDESMDSDGLDREEAPLMTMWSSQVLLLQPMVLRMPFGGHNVVGGLLSNPFLVGNKGRNSMYVSFLLGINCISCLC